MKTPSNDLFLLVKSLSKNEKGYFMTLGAMVLLTILLLIYFWRRGWIFQRDEIIAIKKPAPDDENHEEM